MQRSGTGGKAWRATIAAVSATSCWYVFPCRMRELVLYAATYILAPCLIHVALAAMSKKYLRIDKR